MTSRQTDTEVWADKMISFDKAEPLRRGEWTSAEEKYVDAIVDAFHDGLLDISKGQTLRALLARCLHCHPKRISKKMENSDYHGRGSYIRKSNLESSEIKATETKLLALKADFEESIRHTKMPAGNAKASKKPKAAGAAAAAGSALMSPVAATEAAAHASRGRGTGVSQQVNVASTPTDSDAINNLLILLKSCAQSAAGRPASSASASFQDQSVAPLLSDDIVRNLRGGAAGISGQQSSTAISQPVPHAAAYRAGAATATSTSDAAIQNLLRGLGVPGVPSQRTPESSPPQATATTEGLLQVLAQAAAGTLPSQNSGSQAAPQPSSPNSAAAEAIMKLGLGHLLGPPSARGQEPRASYSATAVRAQRGDAPVAVHVGPTSTESTSASAGPQAAIRDTLQSAGLVPSGGAAATTPNRADASAQALEDFLGQICQATVAASRATSRPAPMSPPSAHIVAAAALLSPPQPSSAPANVTIEALLRGLETGPNVATVPNQGGPQTNAAGAGSDERKRAITSDLLSQLVGLTNKRSRKN